MFFRQNVLVYKESFIFQGVTGNILEEDVDLVVTEVIADHFASYETIEQIIPKKQIPNKLSIIKCFYQNFWIKEIQRTSGWAKKKVATRGVL